MRILAIEKEKDNAGWENQAKILYEEALHVYQLYQNEIIREIYFTDSNNSILILECKDKSEANNILKKIPLVKKGLIDFDIIELHPYTGFSRLFKETN